jgi:hypothetical protein
MRGGRPWAAFFLCAVYRRRFFGHKFELSGLLHRGVLPSETCLARTALAPTKTRAARGKA